MAISIPQIMSAQRTLFATGKTKDIAQRTANLRRLKLAIIDNEQELINALHQDLGKPAFEAYTGEIYLLLDEIKHALKNIRRWTKPQKVKTLCFLFPASSYIYQEPIGVVLIVAPWNYPLQTLLVPLVGALAAGNCAVLKPSEHAPHTAQLIARIIADTFNPSLVTIVEGNVDVAQELLQQQFDHIFFTGSPRVGQLVMEAAAKNLTPVTLELGGKSPCIVDQTASLDLTAKKIVWGKFLNAGQNCVSPDYLLVHKEIKQPLIEKITMHITHLYGRDPMQSTDYARIINNKHFDRLTNLLNNCTVVTGGDHNKTERYIAPTLVTNLSLDHPLMQEEIFGPILPILEYTDFNQAIEFVNSKPKPLALYFFSKNKHLQQAILQQTSSGGVCINDVTIHAGSTTLPFGGIGLSGMGNYHGKYSFDTFSHAKAVLYGSSWFDMPFRYPPYAKLHRWVKRVLNYKVQ